jgi:hypothetical protein
MKNVRFGGPTYNSIANGYIEMHKPQGKHGNNFKKVYNNIKRQLANDKEKAIKAVIAAEILLNINNSPRHNTVNELAYIYNKQLHNYKTPNKKYRIKIRNPYKQHFNRILLNTKKELINGKIKFRPNFIEGVNMKNLESRKIVVPQLDPSQYGRANRGRMLEGAYTPGEGAVKRREHINFLGATVPPNKVTAFYNKYGPRILNAMNYYKLNPSVSKKQALLKFFDNNKEKPIKLSAIYNEYPKRTTNNANAFRDVPNNMDDRLYSQRFISTKNGKTFAVSQRNKTRILNAPPVTTGAYLYLLSYDDKLYFVPVENQFEVYGKHLHIVAEKKVTRISAAGEMVISPDGKTVTFNLLSGTFMTQILKHYFNKYTNITWRKNKIKAALKKLYPNKTIKFVHGYNTLLPTNEDLNANSEASKKYLNSKLNYITYTMTNNIFGN